MGADVSRVRFNPLNDFVGVDMQQGRVLLDGDFNELVDIIDRRIRAACADLGSPGGIKDASGNVIDNTAVVPRTTPDGFRITSDAKAFDLDIGVGRMYVDGILVENHGASTAMFDPFLGEIVNNGPGPGSPPSPPTPVTYLNQPYWPTPDALPNKPGNYLVYMDVWQREVTPLQDPDLIEQAVGVDTTTRIQDVWQVRVFPVGQNPTCASPDPAWLQHIAPSAGRLTTIPVPVEPSTDPCVLPPTGGYRGLENQLYRVQVHDPGPLGNGAGSATFKWSRDNASVTSAVTHVSPTQVTVASLGKDDVLRIKDGDWVEITDDNREFNQQSGDLRKVTVDVANKTLTFAPALSGDLTGGSGTPATRHTGVIRWDQSGIVRDSNNTQVVDLDDPNSPGVIPTPPGAQIVLENGIAVSFTDSPSGGNLRAGDYWVFAARTADTSIELLDHATPRGIHHHYARLALVNAQPKAGPQFTDCRQLWPPECEGGCECTFCLTPTGTTTLQDAITQLQKNGGTICLGPGVYQLAQPVAMNGCQNVRIRGQGYATILQAPDGAFTLTGCIGCTIEDLAIVSGASSATVAIALSGITAGTTLQHLAILAMAPTPPTNIGTGSLGFGSMAVTLDGIQEGLTIRENLIMAAMGITTAPPPDQGGGLLAIATRIESNTISCSQDAVLLRGTSTTEHFYFVGFAFGAAVNANSISTPRAISTPASNGITLVGPMLVEGNLRVEGNQLQVFGDGIITSPSNCVVSANDITSFYVPGLPSPATSNPGVGIQIDNVQPARLGQTWLAKGPATIERNTISGMGAGITVGSVNPTPNPTSAEPLAISHNTIRYCQNGITAVATGDITVSENRLIGLSAQFTYPAPQGTTAAVWGIHLNGGAVSTLVNNTIDGISIVNGIATGIGVASTTGAPSSNVVICGNLISNLTFQGEGGALGIDVRPQFASAGISRNEVQLGTSPSGTVTALQIFGRGNTTPAAVSITDNTLSSPGPNASVVSVEGVQDLQFSGNTVQAAAGSKAAAVELQADLKSATVRCQGNLVRNGSPSINITGSKGQIQVAALGNMTTNQIVTPTPLPAPWSELNVTPI
jgi:hypothetical protein